MKVADGQQVVQGSRATPAVERADAARAEGVAGRSAQSDKVSVAGNPILSLVAARAREGRALRLEQLASQVESGGYRPDPGQIASRLLDEAEVTAQLRGMVGRG